MNQSELEAKTCNQCQGRENACEQGMNFANQSHNAIKQNQRKREISLDTIENRSVIFAMFTIMNQKKRTSPPGC